MMGQSIFDMMMPTSNIPTPQNYTQSPTNPIQMMSALAQAMQNPAKYVAEKFPDIPVNIQNNPAQIMQYLQQTRGINSQQLHQMQQTAEQFIRNRGMN